MGDRLTSLTYPDGRGVSYTRDALGRVSGVTLTTGGSPVTITTSATYRADGLLTAQSFGNGLTETRAYDTQGRLTSQALGALLSLGYTYDANGNVLIRDARSYQYDALNRLSQESEGAPIAYGYEANGNRLTRTQGAQTTSYAYNAGTNQLASIDTSALLYDAAGNLITDEQGRTLTYNNTGRLAEVAQGATTLAAYSYNVQGQRTRKVSASGTVVYHYDLAGHLLAETTHTGVPLRDYVWQDATPVAQIDAAGGLLYLHTDHLGTPRLATNSAGIAVWRFEGEAFGATPPNEDPDQDQILTTVNLRFPGQYYDAETGLYYNWNRYYDPRTGRYITSDPMSVDEHVIEMIVQLRSTRGPLELTGKPDLNDPTSFRPRGIAELGQSSSPLAVPLELNPYAYVANNPLRWTDPTGMFVDFPGISLPPATPGGPTCATKKDCDAALEVQKKICYKLPTRRAQVLCLAGAYTLYAACLASATD